MGVQLKNFSSLLQKGALAIANLLMQEGEKEIAIQFDETEDVVATKQTKRVLTDDDVKNMSFEEFAKFMQINPPGSGNPMERGKRSGTNRLVSTDPVALTTDSSDESKHNSGEKRKLNETQRSCSMSTLEGGPNGNVGEIETGQTDSPSKKRFKVFRKDKRRSNTGDHPLNKSKSQKQVSSLKSK